MVRKFITGGEEIGVWGTPNLYHRHGSAAPPTESRPSVPAGNHGESKSSNEENVQMMKINANFDTFWTVLTFKKYQMILASYNTPYQSP